MSGRVFKILICDLVGLKFDKRGKPDPSELRDHIIARGGHFHLGAIKAKKTYASGEHFFYQPDLSTEAEILPETDAGQYDAVIAAATFLPKESRFDFGGVRIGAGTGNMQCTCWGGPNGIGGVAPLMNTPGFNSRATAQMVMKALLRVSPDLDVDRLHKLSVAGKFDTGKHLRDFPTAKLEGQTLAVIGFGNIGREVAKLAQAFGMKVKVFARPAHQQRIEAGGFVYAPTLVDAARGADVLSTHTGLGAFDGKRFANTGLISKSVLAALNTGAVLINYDRGECVEAKALDWALRTGRVRHAAIDADVFLPSSKQVKKMTGPLVPYLPLAKKYGSRVHLLPHAAADTDHPSRVAGAKQAVDQILAVIREKRVINVKGDVPAGFLPGGTSSPL
jgi:lactate dehydrogenase-like 2-hydroxyacid dehydrogenase